MTISPARKTPAVKSRELPGYWLGRAYWRLADLLDHIPGFNEGTEKAYDLSIKRENRHDRHG
jgi:hypothetical protein